MRTAVVAITLVLFSFAIASPEATACPNCKEAVASQPEEEAGRLKDGYYYSILFMMGMPFALLGTGAFLVARAVKRGALPPL